MVKLYELVIFQVVVNCSCWHLPPLRVARVEQTETPQMMEQRVKKSMHHIVCTASHTLHNQDPTYCVHMHTFQHTQTHTYVSMNIYTPQTHTHTHTHTHIHVHSHTHVNSYTVACPTKYDRVVRREVCSVISKGLTNCITDGLTNIFSNQSMLVSIQSVNQLILVSLLGVRTLSFLDGDVTDAESAFLLAIKEKVCHLCVLSCLMY